MADEDVTVYQHTNPDEPVPVGPLTPVTGVDVTDAPDISVNDQATLDQETPSTGIVVPDTPETTALSGAKTYDELASLRSTTPEQDYTGYETPTGVPDATAGETFMTPETTVAGQLESILKKGSPLQTLAETRANEQASALGMMSSSAGIGASQRALYDEALKVATPDAASATAFKQSEQQLINQQTQIETEAQVSGALTVAKAKIADRQKAIDDSFKIKLSGLDKETEAQMINLKGQWDEQFKVLDANLTRELKRLEIDANVETMIMNQANEAINTYQISIQNLLANEEFLNDTSAPGVRDAVFNDMFVTVVGGLKFAAQASGVYDTEYAGFLDNLADSMQWN